MTIHIQNGCYGPSLTIDGNHLTDTDETANEAVREQLRAVLKREIDDADTGSLIRIAQNLLQFEISDEDTCEQCGEWRYDETFETD